jgi:Zn finger protein HypA/HybF involved in hydrogenase expression
MDWFQCFNCRALTMMNNPPEKICPVCGSKNGEAVSGEALEEALTSGRGIYPTKPKRPV